MSHYEDAKKFAEQQIEREAASQRSIEEAAKKAEDTFRSEASKLLAPVEQILAAAATDINKDHGEAKVTENFRSGEGYSLTLGVTYPDARRTEYFFVVSVSAAWIVSTEGLNLPAKANIRNTKVSQPANAFNLLSDVTDAFKAFLSEMMLARMRGEKK